MPEIVWSNVLNTLTSSGLRILFAAVIFVVGWLLTKAVMKALAKSKLFHHAEGSVQTFVMSIVKIGMFVLLTVIVVNTLGVPMASIITVLASAGVAIGLALQGALSNLAGGIMIIFFKPFKKGDYVDTAGASGTVDEVTLFYTTFLTPDNKRILVPNGQLMNANVVNYSSEETRRVDLNFICSNAEQPSRIESLIMDRLLSCEKVLKDPEPFARLNENSRDAMIFSVKVWCKNDDYWDVYYDLTRSISEAFISNGVSTPTVKTRYEMSAPNTEK